MTRRRVVTGYGLLTGFPLAAWTWRDADGADIPDPLAALRRARAMDAGFALRVNQEQGLIQAIPLLDETLTPAYLLSRRPRRP